MYALTPPGRGRRPAIITYGTPRQLDEADIARLWEGGASSNGYSRIKSLRYNHHMLAKAVASGHSLMECSRLTGLNISRISDLKNDPAFQELVSFYAEELHEVYVNVHERMAALGTSVLEELQDRFETAPEGFTKRELMELFTTVADRSIASAKGGPSPQAGASGGGGNLALQINFVTPSGAPETIEATRISTASPAPIPEPAPPPITIEPPPQPRPDPTQAPAARALASFPNPFASEIAEAKAQASARKALERANAARDRDARRAEFLAQRSNKTQPPAQRGDAE